MSSIVLAAGALLGLALLVTSKRRSNLTLPPGPKPWPLIGNLLDMPHDRQWLVYHELAKKYGDVLHLKVPGQHIVILDSLQAIQDLFEKRSQKYSSRAHSVMLNDLIGFGEWNFVFIPYGDTWRKLRRTFSSRMNAREAPRFQSMHVRQARSFLKQLMVGGVDLTNRIRWVVGATLMDTVYGIQIANHDDPLILRLVEANNIFEEVSPPGRFLVDWIPMLRHLPSWLPGTYFQRLAAHAKWLDQQLISEPRDQIEQQMASGTLEPSMTSELLQHCDEHKLAEERQLIQGAAAVAYRAGNDTTTSAVLSFFLAMTLHPDVQSRAQAEIDAVVGHDRLPDFSDKDKLPYLNAIISELLRWLIIAPLGLPHTTSADDEYNGFFIPKGSMVMGNVWAILHDPEEYPAPEEFKPERFLTITADNKYIPNTSVRDPRVAAFGFGRRICPAQTLAEQTIFTVAASVLATCNILPPVDEHGVVQMPVAEMAGGIVSMPAPFQCRVKARSTRAEELIAQPLPERVY